MDERECSLTAKTQAVEAVGLAARSSPGKFLRCLMPTILEFDAVQMNRLELACSRSRKAGPDEDAEARVPTKIAAFANCAKRRTTVTNDAAR